MLPRKLPLEMFVKKIRNRMLPKSSNKWSILMFIFIIIYFQKYNFHIYKKATKNISIEKLLKKLSLEMFVKNSRKSAAKNVSRKNATRSKSIEMLLKTLSLVTFVKNMRCKRLPNKILRKSVAKSNCTEILLSTLPL